jgi:hypothetical protein
MPGEAHHVIPCLPHFTHHNTCVATADTQMQLQLLKSSYSRSGVATAAKIQLQPLICSYSICTLLSRTPYEQQQVSGPCHQQSNNAAAAATAATATTAATAAATVIAAGAEGVCLVQPDGSCGPLGQSVWPMKCHQ